MHMLIMSFESPFIALCGTFKKDYRPLLRSVIYNVNLTEKV